MLTTGYHMYRAMKKVSILGTPTLTSTQYLGQLQAINMCCKLHEIISQMQDILPFSGLLMPFLIPYL